MKTKFSFATLLAAALVSFHASVAAADPLAAPAPGTVVALPDVITAFYYVENLGFSGGAPYHDEYDDPYFECEVVSGGLPDGLGVQGCWNDDASSIEIVGTPDDDAGGNYAFTIRVVGNGESVEQAYTLTVAENPDHRPVIESKTPGSYRVRIEPDASETFSVEATDEDGDELSYDWTLYDDGWAQIAGDSTTNSWVFDTSGLQGRYFIEVCVTGSNLWTTASWEAIVAKTEPLAAPDTNAVVALPNAMADVEYEDGNLGFSGGVPLYDEYDGYSDEHFDCEVVSGDLPDGLYVWGNHNDDASSIFIAGMPEDDAAGDYAFTIRVVGDGGESAEQAYTLAVVENPDHRPVIESKTPDASRVRVDPSGTQTFSVSATDEDGDELSYAWTLYDDWWNQIDVDDSTTNSWVFDASGVGTGHYYVEVRVTGSNLWTTASWYAVVAGPLAAPDTNAVVALPVAVTGAEYENGNLGFSGGVPLYDEDDNEYFDCTIVGELPDGLNIRGCYGSDSSFIRIEGMPEDDAVGTYEFTIRVVGDFGESAEQAYTLTVAENPDHRPVIESKTPGSYRVRIEPDASETFSVEATDADGDELSYAWTLYDDDWDQIDVGNSTSNSWVFDASGVGTGHYHVEVRVTGSNLWTTASWYAVVAETRPLAAPDAGGVVALPDAVTGADYEDGNLGFAGGVPFYVHEDDGEYFDFEVVSGELPDGLSVQGCYNDDASSIEIGGTPEDDAGGTYNFTIRIDGDGGESVTQAYTLTVVQNAKPVIASASPDAFYVTIRAGETATFGIEASDPDGDPLAVAWKLYDDWGDLISNLTPETDGTVLFSRDAGYYEILAQVDDGFHTEERSWFVTVVAADAILLEAVVPDADWDGVVSVGETVVFSVAADDPESRPLAFEWNLDDATIGETGASWTWTAEHGDVGSHEVGVCCSDGERTSSWVYWTLRVVTTNDLVADVSLPVAVAGEPYSASFSVTGGTEPYSWSTPAYSVSRETNSFAAIGSAKSWSGDDDSWSVSIPFAFPFHGSTYDKAWVSDNGTIYLDGARSRSSFDPDVFESHPMIAPMWRDFDGDAQTIFVDASVSGRLTIRWSTQTYNSSDEAFFSATLCEDGTIRFSYGDDAPGGAVGISAGDGVRFQLPADLQNTDLGGAEDVVFRPTTFAPGMSFSADGTVSGTPTTSGTYHVPVRVVDDEGASWSGTAVFHVVEAGDPVTKTTPVPVPYSWLDGHGLGGGTAEGREAAAKADAANGRPVWACYVADLDPADPAADLVADIEVVDGEPQVSVLEGKSANRVYTVQGAKKLGGGWNDLVAGDDWDAAGFRFFRIKVDLPAE